MDAAELREVVHGELDGMKSTLVKDLREQISGEVSEKFETFENEMGELRTDLNKHFIDNPDDPKAKAVVDLEKRLVESENKQKELETDLRKALTRQLTPEGSKPELNWGGRFLNDSPELRQYLRSWWTLEDQGVQDRTLDSNLFATGGKLPAEVSDQFIDNIVAQQTALSRVQVVRMNSPEGHTDELRVAARKTRKASEATTQAVADSVTTKRRTMNTVELIWAEDISLTFLEDNIERAGAEGHIAGIIGTQFGNDENDLFWNGDFSGSDPFLGINDGLLYKLQNAQDSDVTDYDATASPVPTTNTEVLAAMLRDMPSKFLGRTDHVFWTSVTFAMKYAEEVSTRETGLGDQVLVNGFPALRYFGIQVVPDTHIGAASQRIILTPAANLFYGIQRLFRVDSEWVPRKRIVEYTLTARTDYEYATGEPVVNGTNIPTDLN